MRLVRQTKLAQKGGATDKVYEVDLCEVGPDQFVVNFRWGRRGTALREGSKTTAPVGRAEGEQVFERLVASKVREGYWDVSRPEPAAPLPTAPEPATASPVAPRPTAPPGPTPREARILARLAKGGGGRDVDRAIWLAGVARLAAAEPSLLALAGRGSGLREVSLAFALARLGTQASLPFLERVARGEGAAARLALEGVRRLAPEERRRQLLEADVASLPPPVRGALQEGDRAAIEAALARLLATAWDQPEGESGGGSKRARRRSREEPRELSPEETSVLEALYRIDTPVARHGLISVLARAPLAPGLFLRFRHIFKLAELRDDGEVFGLLAYRFEQASANVFRSGGVRGALYGGRAESCGFLPATRDYLRRRAWRTLRRLGEASSPAYVRMATGVLLPFTDEDAEVVFESEHGRIWDEYGGYCAFSHVLFDGSPRYESARSSMRFRGQWRPGMPAPEVREEAFPALWDRTPGALLHVLDESRCALVHAFAARALEAQKTFLARLDADALAMLLLAPYDVTAKLGWKLASARYLTEEPPEEVLVALAGSRVAQARSDAWRRLENGGARHLANTALVAAIVASPQAETRAFARRWLVGAPMGEDSARILIGRLLAHLEGMEESQSEIAQDVVATLAHCFGNQLRIVQLPIVRDLLRHRLVPLVVLGAEILLARQQQGLEIEPDVLVRLVGSPHEEVRRVGVRIVGAFPDHRLEQIPDVLVALASHVLPDLRAQIRPVLERLVAGRPAFALLLGQALVDVLVAPEAAPGVHADVLSFLLSKDVRPALSALEKHRVLALLRARSSQAQQLGGVLLPTNVVPEELTPRQVVGLASHELLAVRRAAWGFFERLLPRFQADMETTVRLLDGKWADSRQYFAQVFRDPAKLGPEQLTPRVLVAVCDSALPEVQQLGRELITARFDEAHGPEYLLKLSEHPSEALQLFATNYLERFASGNQERLEKLEPYFVSVLSRVNKGRVAKDRVLAFLAKEGSRSLEAAQLVGRIATRQSLTIAATDRARLVEILLELARAYPALSLPIARKPIELRREVPGGV